MIGLSIVIPIYKEKKNLSKLIKRHLIRACQPTERPHHGNLSQYLYGGIYYFFKALRSAFGKFF